MDNLILTYDIGTTGNKCSLCDSSGKKLFSYTFSYDTLYPKPGWSEQRPGDYWDSVIKGTKILLDKSGYSSSNIAVIGLCGHCNGCIPVDHDGNILFNDIIHSDSRSVKECEEIGKVLNEKEYYNLTGNRLDPHWTFPKILWIMNNYPDLYKRTAYFLGGKDYIAYKLTGIMGKTDYMSASLTGMMDIKGRCWAGELTESLKINIDKFPQIKNSFDIAGYITNEASVLTGLKQGTPVIVGGGDGACATKGAGVVGKNQAYNYIGSSSWISALSDKPVFDKDARTFNYFDLDGKSFLVTGTIQCASIAYDWVLNNICRNEIEKCKTNGLNAYDYMDSLAEKVAEGSNGVFFLPYFMGERSPLWDKNTKGGFIGVSLYNKHEDLIRATYEGISFALKSVLEVLEENELSPNSLTLIGGGAISKLWNSIMCNIYGSRLMVHRYPREATTLGAAMAAGVGVGIFRDFKSAVSKIEYDRIFEPDFESVKEYEKFYRVYKMIYPGLKSAFEEMSKL